MSSLLGMSDPTNISHRILRYSFIEGLFIVCISLGQVYIVRLLFNRGSSSRFRV